MWPVGTVVAVAGDMFICGPYLQGGFGSRSQDVVFVICGIAFVVTSFDHPSGCVVDVGVADILVGSGEYPSCRVIAVRFRAGVGITLLGEASQGIISIDDDCAVGVGF